MVNVPRKGEFEADMVLYWQGRALEAEKQLEAVRKTANEYILPDGRFSVSRWEEAENRVAENVLEAIGEQS